MFHTLLLLAMFMLSLSIIVALARIFRRSSTISDRVLLVDSMTYSIIGIVAILSIVMDSVAYLESILLLGILAFLSTIALCRYIERGVVIERKRDR